MSWVQRREAPGCQWKSAVTDSVVDGDANAGAGGQSRLNGKQSVVPFPPPVLPAPVSAVWARREGVIETMRFALLGFLWEAVQARPPGDRESAGVANGVTRRLDSGHRRLPCAGNK